MINETFYCSPNYINNTETIKIEKKEDIMHYTYVGGSTKPNDIFALARTFLYLAPMTHKKLQKLCYYAKAWYLALYDENIVEEQFEAWVHGAVQPELYNKYRIYGFSDIPQITDKSNLPEEFISFAKEVYGAYGHLSGDDLEILNHKEKPWQIARGDCNPWENCRNKISEDSMRTYYRELLQRKEDSNS